MEPHRSAYVKPLSVDDIGDFFEAYTLVQRIVFILSAQRILPAQLERASKIHERLEAACKSANIKAVRDLNLQFHGAIAVGCRNKYLQESYSKLLQDSTRLSSLLLRFTVDTAWNSHAEGIQRDHHKILAALAKHDTQAVGQYCRPARGVFSGSRSIGLCRESRRRAHFWTPASSREPDGLPLQAADRRGDSFERRCDDSFLGRE